MTEAMVKGDSNAAICAVCDPYTFLGSSELMRPLSEGRGA